MFEVGNELTKRLIKTIEYYYVDLLGFDDMEQYRFIPIKIKDGYLYTLIAQDADKDFIANLINKTLPCNVKYIEVSNVDFAKTLDFVIKDKKHVILRKRKVYTDKPIVAIMIISLVVFMLLLVSIGVYFAYKGFFPFNSGKGKDIHYWLFDNYHIAFNISNYTYNDVPYYCKKEYNVQILEINKKNKKYQNDIRVLQNTINDLRQSKYNLTEHDNFKVQFLYDQAHIFNDYYYVEKANNELKVLQSKQKHNSMCDSLIQVYEKAINKINNELIPANNKKMLDYCVRLL